MGNGVIMQQQIMASVLLNAFAIAELPFSHLNLYVSPIDLVSLGNENMKNAKKERKAIFS